MGQDDAGLAMQSRMASGGTGTPVHVDVHAEKDNDGLVTFRHEWRFEGGPSKGHGKIELEPKTPRTPIHFHLHDDTGLHLKFKEKADDAMWVNVGSCPQSKMNVGGQIEFVDPKTSANHLKVDDLNVGAACILKYALCFDGDSGHQADDPTKQRPPYEYDPEIKNGGHT